MAERLLILTWNLSPSSTKQEAGAIGRRSVLYFCILYYTVYRKEVVGVSPVSKYRGFGVYSMNEPGGWSWRKMFITRASVAS